MKKTRRTITLGEKSEVIARYEIGQTSRFIADQTCINHESIKTIIKRYRSGKPSRDELTAIETSKKAIRAALEGDVGNMVDNALVESLNIQKRIREHSDELLDRMTEQIPQDAFEVSSQARALAAIGSTIKIGADFARTLRKEVITPSEEIEVFEISDLTDKDLAKLREKEIMQQRMLGEFVEEK